MIKGNNVFEASSKNSLINKIKEGNYNLPKSVSREFISFLSGMLQFDGQKRLTARQLLDKSFLRKNVKEFHYLSVNHDLKQVKEFLELKSSIILYKEKMNQSVQKSYKKQISSDIIRPNQTLNMPNPNKINQNIINSAPNPNQPYNLQYNFYGQKMTPGTTDVSSTNISSSYPSNFSYPNSMSQPSYQSSLAHSYGPSSNISQQQTRYQSMMNNNNNNSNLNNNSANSYQQSNNNSSINTSFQRYNSQQFDKDKDDDLCIVF